MKQLPRLALIVCVLLAAVIRLYKLGEVPHGMTWDEAAIGYNGYAVLNTRRDEWLVRLPISFRSFGDYKAPLAIYLNGFSTAIFGMNLLAVRLPFALISLTGVVGMAFLSKALILFHLPHTKPRTARWWGVTAAFIMTLSPWHIHYSRVGFESGIALTLLIWGAYFLIEILREPKPSDRGWWWWIKVLASGGLLSLSLYAYHSSKITTPLVVAALLLLKPKLASRRWWPLMVSGAVMVLLSWPLLKDSIYGSGLQRLSSTVFDDQTGWTLLATVVKNMAIHLSPSFLVQGATTTLRHGGGQWGVLLPSVYSFGLVGSD